MFMTVVNRGRFDGQIRHSPKEERRRVRADRSARRPLSSFFTPHHFLLTRSRCHRSRVSASPGRLPTFHERRAGSQPPGRLGRSPGRRGALPVASGSRVRGGEPGSPGPCRTRNGYEAPPARAAARASHRRGTGARGGILTDRPGCDHWATNRVFVPHGLPRSSDMMSGVG